jgi:PAS domain S-box-containing protein
MLKVRGIGKSGRGGHVGARDLGLAGETVRKSEIDYRDVFEAIDHAAALIEDDLTITLVNGEFERLSGYDRAEIEGKKKLFEFLAPHDAGEIRDYFAHGGENYHAPPKNYKIIFTNKQGEPVEAAVILAMVPQSRKSILSLADVRKLREAEESLKISELRFRSLFENSPVGITLANDVSMLYANPAFLRMFGLDEATKLQGQTLANYITPIGRQLTAERPERGVQGQDSPGSPEKEAIGQRKDGTTFPVQIETFMIGLIDGSASVAFISDISERKQAEEALRLSEERFSKAFNFSPCAMSSTHLPDYRIIDVNQRFLDVTGYSREDMIGKLREDMGIWTKQQHQQVKECLKEYGSVNNLETVFRNKKGEEKCGLWSGEIINLDGDPCLLGAWVDITERKEYEKEIARLDRLNLMGEIAGGVAHEIRNPMMVIRGYLQMMQFKEEFASHKKRFDTMIGEIDRANVIITEFLSLAKNKPTELRRQSINCIVTALAPLMQADAAKDQVAVKVDLVDLPDLNLDEEQIRQLILNLVRNGIDAMPKHGELTIKTYMMKNRAVLSIKDRGSGIPPEVLEKIGTPFFTTKEQGTGLGLSVCYRIAESHNAKIQIKTGKRGTAFMVSFKVPSPGDGVNNL